MAAALPVWARIGLLSFGGPAGQIALLHDEVVDKRSWLTEQEFLAALNFCMLLPGPEAMQLATYCGWRMHGVKGGLAAGLLFVLPGALVILALSAAYAVFGNLPLVEASFFGIKCAVVAIVLEALLKVARKALTAPLHWFLATAAFVALFVFALPFPLVVIAAGLLGWWLSPKGHAPSQTILPSIPATFRTIVLSLVAWFVPLLLLMALAGPASIHAELAKLFSILAVVTFGGAYAVLASLGQTVVDQMHWLTPQQMMDGFGLAETTPGPLILVGQFVAFMAASQAKASLWHGLLASAVFLWMTFAPCFLWVFAGAPWISFLTGWPRVKAALAAITASVTGVILNLTVWFALHVLFAQVSRLDGPLPIWWPVWSSWNPLALVLTLGLATVLLWRKMGIPKTLALGLAAGLICHFALNAF